MRTLFSLTVLALLTPRIALADETIDIDGRWRLEGSFHVSYMIAGGSSYRGGRAPSTGGVAFVPALRVLYAHRLVDPYAAVAPLLVTPYSAKSFGFVGAMDLGLAWHPNNRSWVVGTGGTFAPSYERFCNGVPWCLREGVILYGGETHFAGSVLRTEGGGGLTWNVSARLLTGRPTAWYWPTLTPTQAAVNHASIVIGGGMNWRF